MASSNSSVKNAAQAVGNTKTGNVLDWGLMGRVLALVKPYKGIFIGATLVAILLAVLAPLRPYLIQYTVDNTILQPDGPGLRKMLFVLLAVLLLESVARYIFTYSTSWLGQSITKRLRVRVFKQVLDFRLRYFDTTPIGTSTTRTINDVETINDIFSQGLITIIADLLKLVTIIIVMFATDWKLSLVCLAPFPLIVYATYIFKERIKHSFQQVRTQVSRLNAFLQEHITGMSIIQIFSAEVREMDKFKRVNAAHRDAYLQSILYYSIFFPALEIILAGALGLLVWFGANQVIANEVSLGVLIAFILYLNMLFRPLRMLADKFNTLQMGLVASERVFTLLDRHEIIEDKGTISAAKLNGDIRFENVWFAYNEKDMVLKGISFELKAGETLAIVGATGAGKSTIINILNRFYPIQKGRIYIDNIPLQNYSLDSLRAHIGLVLQDVFLFSGSIYENITLRDKSITKDRVIEAAKFVGAHDFIEKLPEQYNYNVMERGATLSLGQRQLISFIRALVFNPQILILDEATSSIDTETEQLLQIAVEKLVKDRTSIVIAHRLSTIQHADKVMVLEKGQIIEFGSHEELLNSQGHYRQLYETQFANTANTANN